MKENTTVLKGYKLSNKVNNICTLAFLISTLIFGSSLFFEVPRNLVLAAGIVAIIVAVIEATTKLSIWVKKDV